MKEIVEYLVLGVGAVCMYLAGYLHATVVQSRPREVSIKFEIKGAAVCSDVMEAMSDSLRSKSG